MSYTTSDTVGSTNAMGILKRVYKTGLENLVIEPGRFLSLINKKQNMAGQVFEHTVQYGTGTRGASRSYATAYAGSAAAEPAMARFSIRNASVYGLARVSNELIALSTTGDAGAAAYVSGLKQAVSDTLYNVNQDISIALFSDGFSYAKAGAGTTGSTIVLADPSQIYRFQVGMQLSANTTNGLTSGTPVAASANTVITAIVEESWTITTAGPHGFSSGNWLFDAGADKNGSAIDRGLLSMFSWCPLTTPTTGDSFLGFDRSVSPSRLAGTRYTPAASNVGDALTDAYWKAAKMAGLKVDTLIVNPATMAQLEKEWATKLRDVVTTTKVANIQIAKGEEVVMKAIGTGSDAVTIIVDHFCPKSTPILTRKDSWYLSHTGKDIVNFAGEGPNGQELPDADSRLIKVSGYLQLVNTAPKDTVIVNLAGLGG